MNWNFGDRVRVIDPGVRYGECGTIVPDPDSTYDPSDPTNPDNDIDPEDIEAWLWVKLDSGEIYVCHEPWGLWETFLEKE